MLKYLPNSNKKCNFAPHFRIKRNKYITKNC